MSPTTSMMNAPVSTWKRMVRRLITHPGAKMWMRRLAEPIYALGNNVECCYCGWTGAIFLPAGQQLTPNRLCPRCGSLQRDRMIGLYLGGDPRFGRERLWLLEVAPQPCFRDFCRQRANLTYISSDIDRSYTMLTSDLTQMALTSDRFDLIVCLHVLEHIPNDLAALAELYRMLKPGGIALVMVPLQGEQTFEDPTATPADYQRLYGQHDHVRIYGLDIAERMRRAGFQVEILDMYDFFSPEQLKRYALGGDDQYLFRLTKSEL